MTVVYEALNKDHATAQEAKAAVEAAGSGQVVKFHVLPNLPGRLPELVHRSCAMWVYEEGAWSEIGIHAGGRWAGAPE